MPPPTDLDVRDAQHVLDERDLVRDLGPPRSATKGRLGLSSRRPRDSISRIMSRPASRRRGWQGGDALGGGVGAVRRAEGVVDVQLRRAPRAAWRTRGRCFVSSDGTAGFRGGARRHGELPSGRGASGRRSRATEATGAAEELAGARATGAATCAGSDEPFGPAEVRNQDHARAGLVEQVPNRGQRGPDARVIGHRAAVQGHVEVDPDQDALAGQGVDVRSRQCVLVHSCVTRLRAVLADES